MRRAVLLAMALAAGLGGWSAGSAALASKATDAEAAFANGEDATAIRLFSEALAETTDPKAQVAAYFGRGEIYALNRRLDEAIADFTAALSLDKDPATRASSFYSRAESHSRRGETEAALQDYADSIALQPALIGLHYARGALYARLGKREQAVADFDAELKQHPTYYRAAAAKAQLLGLPPPPEWTPH